MRGDKGEIESVQYRALIPLMLNEMQHQQAALTALKAQKQMQQHQQAELTALKLRTGFCERLWRSKMWYSLLAWNGWNEHRKRKH